MQQRRNVKVTVLQDFWEIEITVAVSLESAPGPDDVVSKEAMIPICTVVYFSITSTLPTHLSSQPSSGFDVAT